MPYRTLEEGLPPALIDETRAVQILRNQNCTRAIIRAKLASRTTYGPAEGAG